MKIDKLELLEEYNLKGVCIKRTINGVDLPADKDPSIAIFKNVSSITQKFYLTPEEAKNRYGIIINSSQVKMSPEVKGRKKITQNKRA